MVNSGRFFMSRIFWILGKTSAGSSLYRLLKNSLSPFETLRANGIGIEITSKNPFMLSLVEACR
jgi:hypothetical protein